MRLPIGPDAPKQAREAVREVMAHESLDKTSTAALLTSAIVTNAVTHAGLTADDMIVIEAEVADGTLRVSVTDDGPGFEIPTPPAGDLVEGGIGLVLIDRFSDRWGVEHDGPNVVWFELDLP